MQARKVLLLEMRWRTERMASLVRFGDQVYSKVIGTSHYVFLLCKHSSCLVIMVLGLQPVFFKEGLPQYSPETGLLRRSRRVGRSRTGKCTRIR